MFVVCRKLPGSTRSCVLICKSERNGKKVTQKTVKYYGVAHSKEQRLILVEQARKEIAKLQSSQSTIQKATTAEGNLADCCDGARLGHMAERFRVTEGFHAIFGPIFDELNLAPLFTKIRYNQLRDVVIARIAHPASKLHTAFLLKNIFLRPKDRQFNGTFQ